MTLDADIALHLGDLDLAVHVAAADHSVVAVLGPNGAGKSTLVRTLAGLFATETGRVTVDDITLDEPASGTFVPPEQRRIGVVFQDYLLFPHLTALDNVAFGPRSAGASRADARASAAEWLERVGLGQQRGAKPHQLSGGQAQRVALARALAADPRLLLLDEPLAALDAGTRLEVRRDLRRHLEAFDGATILVTHDPLDALALADEVVIVEHGRVAQSGPIAEVTGRPRSTYVAQLIGTNLLRGVARGPTIDLGTMRFTVASRDNSGPVFLTIAPNAIALHREPPMGSPRNQWSARIDSIDLLGDRIRVRLSGPPALVAEITPASAADLHLREGDAIWAAVKATEIAVYAV